MTPQDARDAMIAAGMLAWDWQDRGDEHLVAAYFDALTERGFSISLDSVRDHTNCDTSLRPCIDGTVCGHVIPCDHPRRVCSVRVPCGGSPVVWAAPPNPESETP